MKTNDVPLTTDDKRRLRVFYLLLGLIVGGALVGGWLTIRSASRRADERSAAIAACDAETAKKDAETRAAVDEAVKAALHFEEVATRIERRNETLTTALDSTRRSVFQIRSCATKTQDGQECAARPECLAIANERHGGEITLLSFDDGCGFTPQDLRSGTMTAEQLDKSFAYAGNGLYPVKAYSRVSDGGSEFTVFLGDRAPNIPLVDDLIATIAAARDDTK